jgi:mono/diheme cytochrome c family protein
MGKRAYISFAVVAAFLVILIPAWAITKSGGESASPENVPSSLQGGKDLFSTNCGACHTLAKAGTDGTTGPNLDKLLGSANATANKARVLNAVTNGINGRMPKGIVTGAEADEVATFVSSVASSPATTAVPPAK